MKNFLIIFLILSISSCRSLGGPGDGILTGAPEKVLASYYDDALHGNPTASGEPYDASKYTAAHRTLPFGTKLRVRNVKNGKSIVVSVNDRGPFVRGRSLDLSRAAASALGFVSEGVAMVEMRVLESTKTDNI